MVKIKVIIAQHSLYHIHIILAPNFQNIEETISKKSFLGISLDQNMPNYHYHQFTVAHLISITSIIIAFIEHCINRNVTLKYFPGSNVLSPTASTFCCENDF